MEQRDTFVYILMSIFKFCSFHKEYYNNPLFIVYFYNSKRITLFENVNKLYLYRLVENAYYGFVQFNYSKACILRPATLKIFVISKNEVVECEQQTY